MVVEPFDYGAGDATTIKILLKDPQDPLEKQKVKDKDNEGQKPRRLFSERKMKTEDKRPAVL